MIEEVLFLEKIGGQGWGERKKKMKSYTISLGSATNRHKHTKNTFIPHVMLNYSWVINMLTQPVNFPHFGILYIMYIQKKKKNQDGEMVQFIIKVFTNLILYIRFILYHHHIMIIFFFSFSVVRDTLYNTISPKIVVKLRNIFNRKAIPIFGDRRQKFFFFMVHTLRKKFNLHLNCP